MAAAGEKEKGESSVEDQRLRLVLDGRTLRVRGEIDLSSADGFGEALERLVSGEGEFFVDCSDLRFIDSTGIRAILRLDERLETNNARLVLRSCPPGVSRIFEITGLDNVPRLAIEAP